MVGHAVEGRHEKLCFGRIDAANLKRFGHAEEPLVSLTWANWKGKVSHAKSRVAILFPIELWSAHPARQEKIKFLDRNIETFRMHGANGLYLWKRIHLVIELAYERLDAFGTAEIVEERVGTLFGIGVVSHEREEFPPA